LFWIRNKFIAPLAVASLHFASPRFTQPSLSLHLTFSEPLVLPGPQTEQLWKPQLRLHRLSSQRKRDETEMAHKQQPARSEQGKRVRCRGLKLNKTLGVFYSLIFLKVSIVLPQRGGSYQEYSEYDRGIHHFICPNSLGSFGESINLLKRSNRH
jgi:hypothetical protein